MRLKLLIPITLAALFLAWQQAPPFLSDAKRAGQAPVISQPPVPLRVTPAATGPKLKVTYFDVGQGDAALIQTPAGQNILVDGGPDERVLEKIGQVLPRAHYLDAVFLTHPHADHLNGLLAVLRRYSVGQIYYTGVNYDSAGFAAWQNLIETKKIPLILVTEPQILSYGPVKLEIIYPDQDLANSVFEAGVSDRVEGAEINNTSIVFRLVYGKSKFLFMGDAETEAEKDILEGGADLDAQVLKVGHHGSHSSTGENFLSAVDPDYAVISVGEDNDYGHPHRRTLRRLERHGVEILRTDLDGDIEFTSDGERVVYEH